MSKNKNTMRIKITIGLFLIVIFFISGFLFKIMVIDGEELKKKSLNQSFREVETDNGRGSIYDRNGVPLAISIDVWSYALDPLLAREDKDLHNKIRQLSRVLDMPEENLVDIVNKQNRFVWVKRLLEDEEAKELRDIKLKGSLYLEESKRVYPKGQFMSNLIGFVGRDNKGLEGLEYYYDSLLKGNPGKILLEEDSRGRSINSSVYQIIPPVDGMDIYLTIDETIQYITERRLLEAVEELKADKALAMVYDIDTGQLLSVANYPTFDPNVYASYSDDHFRNLTINSVYEMGSTFKPFVAAAAIEEAKVGRNEIFQCDASIKVLNYNIREIIYPKSYGKQTITEALQNSSNTGFVQIGQRLGKEDFYRYLRGFGLEGKTGIDLPGERTSNIIPERKATILDISVASIGQGNAITPLQLIRGFGALVNDGKLMQVNLLKEAKDSKGNITQSNEPKILNTVISEETSSFIREAMVSVVDEGTGKRVRIEGFEIGGKTGTAQKVSQEGGYLDNQVVTSFIGFAPGDDPRFACLVLIDNPVTYKTGSQAAGPVFKDIMTKVLDYYDILPETIIEESANKGNKNNLKERVLKYHSTDLENLTAYNENPQKFILKGEGGYIQAQYPFEGEDIKENEKITLYLSDKNKNEIIVPDLKNLTILEASRLLEQMELLIKVNGSGYVESQLPSKDSLVRKDTIVQVYFNNRSEGESADDQNQP